MWAAWQRCKYLERGQLLPEGNDVFSLSRDNGDGLSWTPIAISKKKPRENICVAGKRVTVGADLYINHNYQLSRGWALL